MKNKVLVSYTASDNTVKDKPLSPSLVTDLTERYLSGQDVEGCVTVMTLGKAEHIPFTRQDLGWVVDELWKHCVFMVVDELRKHCVFMGVR